MNPAASTYKVKSVAPYIENFANWVLNYGESIEYIHKFPVDSIIRSLSATTGKYKCFYSIGELFNEVYSLVMIKTITLTAFEKKITTNNLWNFFEEPKIFIAKCKEPFMFQAGLVVPERNERKQIGANWCANGMGKFFESIDELFIKTNTVLVHGDLRVQNITIHGVQPKFSGSGRMSFQTPVDDIIVYNIGRFHNCDSNGNFPIVLRHVDLAMFLITLSFLINKKDRYSYPPEIVPYIENDIPSTVENVVYNNLMKYNIASGCDYMYTKHLLIYLGIFF
jgi:hypothetical protein